jgi:hypothetical protein
MGSRRVEKHADQNVDGDEQASPAEKRLEEVHVTLLSRKQRTRLLRAQGTLIGWLAVSTIVRP